MLQTTSDGRVSSSASGDFSQNHRRLLCLCIWQSWSFSGGKCLGINTPFMGVALKQRSGSKYTQPKGTDLSKSLFLFLQVASFWSTSSTLFAKLSCGTYFSDLPQLNTSPYIDSLLSPCLLSISGGPWPSHQSTGNHIFVSSWGLNWHTHRLMSSQVSPLDQALDSHVLTESQHWCRPCDVDIESSTDFPYFRHSVESSIWKLLHYLL